MQMTHKTDSTKYSAEVKVTIAAAHGCSRRMDTKEKTNAGNGPQNLWREPNASVKNAYSPPERGTTAPNSAKARAPTEKYLWSLRSRIVISSFYPGGWWILWRPTWWGRVRKSRSIWGRRLERRKFRSLSWDWWSGYWPRRDPLGVSFEPRPFFLETFPFQICCKLQFLIGNLLF